MSEKRERHGRCLCGAVRVLAKQAGDKVGACHCAMCRRWSSGPFMEIAGGTEIVFDGAENVTVFDSSPWAERGFCNKCGSHLFYRLKENNEHMMAVGLFEEDEDLTFTHQVFVDKRPHYYSFSNKTDDMTEAEVFEKFGSPS